MPTERIVVLMGSKKDYEFASRIEKFLREEGFPVSCEYNVASAHKTPQKLLDDLQRYETSRDNIVLITVAGLSDALSGVVAGYSIHPVIACPPDSERHSYAKIFSSVSTPRGVPVAYVPEPENAALAAVRILALTNRSLQNKVAQFKLRMEEKVRRNAQEIRKKPSKP